MSQQDIFCEGNIELVFDFSNDPCDRVTHDKSEIDEIFDNIDEKISINMDEEDSMEMKINIKFTNDSVISQISLQFEFDCQSDYYKRVCISCPDQQYLADKILYFFTKVDISNSSYTTPSYRTKSIVPAFKSICSIEGINNAFELVCDKSCGTLIDTFVALDAAVFNIVANKIKKINEMFFSQILRTIERDLEQHQIDMIIDLIYQKFPLFKNLKENDELIGGDKDFFYFKLKQYKKRSCMYQHSK